jgi:isocitrate dehydrogenase (NAD+)
MPYSNPPAPGGLSEIGTRGTVFEATHGPPPHHVGLNKVDPTPLILSCMLMLEHMKEPHAARRLEAAVAAVIAEGRCVTYDMKPTRDDPTAVGTIQMADAIIKAM